MTWTPTRIRWASEPLATSTGAARVETDQGPAYAKFQGNPEGSQALFCDLLGTRAASWLGLPTFEVAAVNVDAVGLVTYPDGSRSQAGPAFIARYEEGTTWGGASAELEAVENLESLAGLVVLDTWLLNCDRFTPDDRCNVRNVFLSARGASKGKFRLTAIDHTHCLTCGWELKKAIANIDRRQSPRLFGHFPQFKPHVSRQRLRLFTDRLKQFTERDAEQLLAGIPAAWGPPSEVRRAVGEFLAGRAAFVGQNVQNMLLDTGYLQPELELEG